MVIFLCVVILIAFFIAVYYGTNARNIIDNVENEIVKPKVLTMEDEYKYLDDIGMTITKGLHSISCDYEILFNNMYPLYHTKDSSWDSIKYYNRYSGLASDEKTKHKFRTEIKIIYNEVKANEKFWFILNKYDKPKYNINIFYSFDAMKNFYETQIKAMIRNPNVDSIDKEILSEFKIKMPVLSNEIAERVYSEKLVDDVNEAVEFNSDITSSMNDIIKDYIVLESKK